MTTAKEKKFVHSRPFFYGFLTLVFAICVARFLFQCNIKYIIAVVVAFVLFAVFCIFTKKFLAFALVLATFAFGVGWFFVGYADFRGNVYNADCFIQGRVSDDISVYNERVQLKLVDVKINGRADKNIELQINMDGDYVPSAGDVIEFTGFLTNTKLFKLETFDLSAYRKGTAYECKASANDIQLTDNYLKLDEKIRLSVKDVLYQHMGEGNGALAYAMLFGDKTDVGDEKDLYTAAGVVHILTVSGLHVGFLLAALTFILKKCRVKRWWNFAICAVFLALYAYLCGFSPSVLRASVVGLVLLAAKFSGKWYDGPSAIGLAGIIILLCSPLSALDNGFLMSFFCVISIYTVAPIIRKILAKVFPNFASEAISLSCAAQLGIMPFTSNFYSSFNFLFVFANILVVPFFSVLFPLLFLFTLLCLVTPFFGFLLKGVSAGIDLINTIAKFFADTNLIVEQAPLLIFLIMAIFLLCFVASKFFMAKKSTKRICVTVCAAIVCVVYAISLIPMPTTPSISCCYDYSSFYLLTNSSGESLMIDVGSSNSSRDLLRLHNIKSVENVISLKSTNISVVRKLGVQNIICADKGQGYEEDFVIKSGEIGQIGHFSYKYVASEEKLLGVEISFDEIDVLCLTKLLTEEDLSAFQAEKYDFVLAGENSAQLEFFARCKNVWSVYSGREGVYNYIENGNMCCELSDKNFKWRCLD